MRVIVIIRATVSVGVVSFKAVTAVYEVFCLMQSERINKGDSKPFFSPESSVVSVIFILYVIATWSILVVCKG